MIKYLFSIVLLIPVFGACCCGNTCRISVLSHNNSVPISVLGVLQNNVIIVNDSVNLDGRTCFLPKSITLDIRKGKISNGILVGNNSKLKCSDGSLYRVTILGSWNVPVIKSSFFQDLDYENSLKDVFALTSPSIKNRVYI